MEWFALPQAKFMGADSENIANCCQCNRQRKYQSFGKVTLFFCDILHCGMPPRGAPGEMVAAAEWFTKFVALRLYWLIFRQFYKLSKEQ